VRTQCPKAVIFYFGFFPGFSYESSASQISNFMKHEYGDDVAWWFNEHIYEVEDIDRLINEGQTRALWFHGRWMYWTRQAVAEAAADDDVRGPGIVYIPSGVTESNAAFTGRSWLWEKYEEPTIDGARTDRLAKLPRNNQLDLMRALLLHLLLHFDSDADKEGEEAVDDARDRHGRTEPAHR
jgi:hypothetical protein